MNNQEKLNDFMNHMPESITKRQKGEIFKTLNEDLANPNKEVNIQISEDNTVLTATIKEGNAITTQTIDIKKMLPKKKNRFIEWLNN